MYICMSRDVIIHSGASGICRRPQPHTHTSQSTWPQHQQKLSSWPRLSWEQKNSCSPSPPHLPSQQTGADGTKSWEETYRTEIENFACNPDDEGTIWFEETGAEERMVGFVLDALPEPLAGSVLDVGTGNGHLLFALRDAGFRGTLVGIDYSAASVALARLIGSRRAAAAAATAAAATIEAGGVRFEVVDFLHDPVPRVEAAEGYDMLLDKGTFDAISLSPGAAAATMMARYPRQVCRALKHGGRLLVTTCNWTEDEIRSMLECPPAAGDSGVEGRLEWCARVEYAQGGFVFGGKRGQAVCTVCFRKV